MCIYLAGTIDLLRFIGPNPNEPRSPDEFRQLVQDKGEEFIDSITEGIIEFHRRLKDLEIMPIAVTLPPLGRARFEQYDPIIKLQREIIFDQGVRPVLDNLLTEEV